MSTSRPKLPLLSLPLAKSLPQSPLLTADSIVPTARDLFQLSKWTAPAKDADPSSVGRPSFLRRSRPVKAHYAYVTPLPVGFPYAVSEEVAKELIDQETGQVDIEAVLAYYEPSLDTVAFGEAGKVQAFTSSARDKAISKAELFGLSQKCLDEVLPGLDVGDAFEHIKSGEVSKPNEARDQLLAVLSGKAVLGKVDGEGLQFAPWSLCYSGHQFGSYAGQLGDGRAISIFTTEASPKAIPGTYSPPIAELQLKGAGRTPFSRFADGLAVLRSSVREYLGSEAMAALSIPTSRALSLIHLPDLEVVREQRETGAVVCRVAPSWLRIGSFQIHKERSDWDKLLALAQYAASELFGLDLAKDGDKAVQTVLKEVARRNAIMVAGWQAYGFMHGVINTDNVSLLGLTIDYGPYAFMDVYDAGHICNHSDGEGRYAYRLQPSMGDFAIRKLGEALGELLGAELTSGKVQAGWAEGKDASQLEELRKKGMDFVMDVQTAYKADFEAEWLQLLSKRFGLSSLADSDQAEIFEPFFSLMSNHEVDFTNSFRLLCQFKGVSAPNYQKLLDLFLPEAKMPKFLHATARDSATQWFIKYEARLSASDSTAGADHTDREKQMQAVNPRFTLRQWVLEEAIKRLSVDKDTAFLQQVLDMCTKPFESYGEPRADAASDVDCPTKDVQEQQRLCGIGSKDMLGFQCSCSS